ncbi:MAG: ATP-grasp domain-containing protein [Bryobacteraceae bacterium]
MTILRTAAGSAPSVSQIQRFQQKGLRVVAVDSDPLSVGCVFADASYQVPVASSPDYVDELLHICSREHIDWVLPNLDEELVLLSKNRQRFQEIGTRLMLSATNVVGICTDKLRTSAFFHDSGIPGPRTWNGSALPPLTELGSFPKIVKPRFGRGSTGVHVVHSTEELLFHLQRSTAPVVQDVAAGVEFTVDALADFDGTLQIVSPRRRLATDSGISSKGCCTWNPLIVEWVARIVRTLPIIGPANIQCFVSAAGEIAFTEINARIAGSCILTEAAGVPYFDGIIAMLRGVTPPQFLEPAAERVMLRYWSEVYLTPQQASELARKSHVAGCWV